MNHSALLSLLYDGQDVSVRDALWKDIPLSRGIKGILDTRVVQKLGRIRQLGPASLVYPSAVHTRLDHSLGVYHLCRLIIASLAAEGAEDVFTETGVRSFLAAGLLHDIGHFPYAHSLKELPLESHEHRAALLIHEDGELLQAVAASGADPDMTAAIIDDGVPTDDEETACFRRLLSGTLDPDKLDYLNRDAFFCGVPYGSQDAPYLIAHLSLSDGRPVLAYKAIGGIEHILFGKYLMYRSVYWHEGTRSATAMIKKALLCALRDHALALEDLYGLDDDEFYALSRTVSHPAFSLIRDVRDGRLLRCVFEEDWNEDRPLDKAAATLEGRMAEEDRIHTALAKKYPALRPWEIVIDIPEPISFEADMPVRMPDGTLKPFLAVDQLFQSDLGHVFERCLRKTRVFAPAYVDGKDVRNLV